MVITSASQAKGSQSVNKRTTLGKPVHAKSTSSSIPRSAVTLAVKNASKPVAVPPVTKPTDPRLEVATSVASQVNESLGLPKGKAKALSLAVTEAVVKAMPKYMPEKQSCNAQMGMHTQSTTLPKDSVAVLVDDILPRAAFSPFAWMDLLDPKKWGRGGAALGDGSSLVGSSSPAFILRDGRIKSTAGVGLSHSW